MFPARQEIQTKSRPWRCYNDSRNKFHDQSVLFLRLGAARSTTRDGFSHSTRPSRVTFQTTIAIPYETKAGFEGLEENPDTTGEKCHGPCYEPQQQKPEKGKARIAEHIPLTISPLEERREGRKCEKKGCGSFFFGWAHFLLITYNCKQQYFLSRDCVCDSHRSRLSDESGQVL